MFADGEFLVGAVISVLTIAVQALATILVVRAARIAARHLSPRRKIETLIIVMAMSGVLLTLGHFIEVAIWAELYNLLGVIPRKDVYYLAFVNFTTLGYGDILPTYEWRLLGPITAANGMLLFGWSTAVLYAVLARALRILRLE
ncbi:potassium channel family protein [Xanthobacter autotrophicus]|uniref:ion channel n=1 Tax=Xanthobacter TaxID=279 RepID=UPI0024AA794C|nr:ion channel [Xanthobacter autotrophicus]MDI4664308.1 potassium channel family protein [Xanthobacter autotrophicus]